MESNKSCLNWRQKYGVPFEKTDLTLKVVGKVKSKVTIGKNPTTLVQVIFLCDAYFSNYPAGTLTHPVYYLYTEYSVIIASARV